MRQLLKKFAIVGALCVGLGVAVAFAATAKEEAQAQRERIEELISNCTPTYCFGINWEHPGLREAERLPQGIINRNGSSPLHYAARNCVPSAHLYALARAGHDINRKEGKNGFTPLQLALVVCKSEVVGYLLGLGADPNVISKKDGGNLLHLAIRLGKPRDLIKRLIRSEINLDHADFHQITPLMLMFLREDLEMATLLLNAGANPNVADINGITPAHYAAQQKDHALLKKLYGLGANLDVVSNKGQTPLHLAAAGGMTSELAAIFYGADANVDAYDNDGLTPLHYASGQSSARSVATLLVLKATVDALNNVGDTPLHYALRYNEDPKAIQALLRLGADPNLRDSEGRLPIELAASRNNNAPELLIELISYGADVSYVDENLRTLLHHAVMQNNGQLAATLLRYGANPYAEDRLGKTPVHLVTERGISEPAYAMFQSLEAERQAIVAKAGQNKTERDEKRELRNQDLRAKYQERFNKSKSNRSKIITEKDGNSKLSILEKQMAGLRAQNDKAGSALGLIKKNIIKLDELEQVAASVRDQLDVLIKETAARRAHARGEEPPAPEPVPEDDADLESATLSLREQLDKITAEAVRRAKARGEETSAQ